ncbi:MAG: hypothetical protein L3J36_14355 [Rhodobacteraceae bacterium]|nr:hypothetical protein [Paracoccaceae bacterium]
MLNLLSSIFGPHRAVSVYVFLRSKGLILLALVGFVAIVSSMMILTGPREHEHVAFMTLPVVSAVSTGGNTSGGVIATLRLPDGETVAVTSTEANIAALVTDTACVEKRRFVDTGEARFRLKTLHHCANN